MTYVAVTTLNEARTIAALIRTCRAQGWAVIVADAASTDGTAAIARRAGATVLDVGRCPIGPALMAAWHVALDAGAERVLQMDAGGSHDPLDGRRLLASHGDLVIGSRFVPGARYFGRPWRRVGSRAAGVACMLRTGVPLHDWTSGFRAFTPEALQVALAGGYRAMMHGWQIEVLVRVLRVGLTVYEVPIQYRAGRSSFGWREVREACRVWAAL
jgi:dolichol-phosphate mannosyltransferase